MCLNGENWIPTKSFSISKLLSPSQLDGRQLNRFAWELRGRGVIYHGFGKHIVIFIMQFTYKYIYIYIEMHAYLTIMPNYRYGMLRNVTRFPLLSPSTSIYLKNLLLIILEAGPMLLMVIST